MIATAFGMGNDNDSDKLNQIYSVSTSKAGMYSIAFNLLIAVIVLIPCFLCIIPCVPGFRNWEYKPSS
jgi:hypothetical protein